MEKLELNIIPKEGLGKLYFGLNIDEIASVLGEPSEVEEISDDDDFNTLILNYSELGLSIFFEGRDQASLSCLEVDNRNCILFGKKVFSLTEQEIVSLMNENGFSDIDMEDEEWGEHRVSFEDGLIDFYFTDGVLTTINWGVLVNDQGEVEEL